MTTENNNQPQGALSPEEMQAISTAAIKANVTNTPVDVSVIAKVKEDFNTVTKEQEKVSVAPGEPRLPTVDQIQELKNIDRSKLEYIGSEVLHANVQPALTGDPTYVPPTPIIDTVMPEFEKVETKEGIVAPQGVTKSVAAEAAYDGPGVMIQDNGNKPVDVAMALMPPETQGDLALYLEGMGADMVESKGIRDMMAEVNPNLTSPQDQAVLVDGMSQQELARKLRATEESQEVQERRAQEAMVVINKLEGSNITFTEEEKSKIEEAKVIRVNEIKTVDLKSIKKRRDKKPEIRQAIRKKGNTMRTTQVILPASGFTAEMLGCSPYEIMTLQQDEDPITDNEMRWNLVWSKIKATSINIKSFDEFYNKVAADDFEVLLWGILRSTFEDHDTISLNCINESCKKQDGSAYTYDYKYSVTQLLRPEFITEEMNESMKRIVGSHDMESMLEAHNLSPINSVEVFMLPQSGYIFELGIRSAHDFVTKSLASLASENLEPQYRQSAIMATSVNQILIPEDPSDPDTEYYQYDTPEEIMEVIYNLDVNDLLLLSHKASDVNNDVSFKFGFTDVVCPKCGNHTKFQHMDISTILFYRNALAMNVNVE